jgi:hypothetical protein
MIRSLLTPEDVEIIDSLKMNLFDSFDYGDAKDFRMMWRLEKTRFRVRLFKPPGYNRVTVQGILDHNLRTYGKPEMPA